MKGIRSAVLSAIVGLGLLSPVRAATVTGTFDFESASLGQTTPLALTSNGIMATFATNGFYVDNGARVTAPFTGNYLTFASLGTNALTINFDTSLSSLDNLLFATPDPTVIDQPISVVVSLLQDSTPVQSQTFLVPNDVAVGAWRPQLVTNVTPGQSFNRIQITAASPGLAIDDVVVTGPVGGGGSEPGGGPGTIPEPTTFGLLAAGLLSTAVLRRIKRA
jgi:PEP-CTERM motif